MTSLRRALLGLGIAGFVAGVVPLLIGLDSHDGKPNIELVAVFGPLITWAFIGTGLYAWWRQPENRIGVLMTIVGFAWAVGGLSVSPDPGGARLPGRLTLT